MMQDDLNRIGNQISKLDIFDHLLSVHHPASFSVKGDPLRNEGWYAFSTFQGPKTLNRRQLYQQLLAYRHLDKPLYAQETLWANNLHHPDYSLDDIRKNAIVLIMVDAAINFADNNGNSSSGFSGSLDLGDRAQQMHDELKRAWSFFETIPFYTMRPHLSARWGRLVLVLKKSRFGLKLNFPGILLACLAIILLLYPSVLLI